MLLILEADGGPGLTDIPIFWLLSGLMCQAQKGCYGHDGWVELLLWRPITCA